MRLRARKCAICGMYFDAPVDDPEILCRVHADPPTCNTLSHKSVLSPGVYAASAMGLWHDGTRWEASGHFAAPMAGYYETTISQGELSARLVKPLSDPSPFPMFHLFRGDSR
jgi:hypothetical protein